MGSASSTPKEVADLHVDSSKENLALFVGALVPLAEPGTAGRDARREEWPRVDATGGHKVSLAECETWIRVFLARSLKKVDKETIDRMWRAYRPSYLLAFEDANDVEAGDANGDYVTPKEFRIMVADVCAYAAMMDCFDLVDGGKIANNPDDRRISLEEWTDAWPALTEDGAAAAYGFDFLKRLGKEEGLSDPEEVFRIMDSDGAGMVRLKEWCETIKRYEVEAGTLVGKTLGMLR